MTESPSVLRPDEVRAMVQEERLRVLRAELPPMLKEATSKEYLANGEVAQPTGWTRRQLADRRKKGRLPHLKRGRTIWYRAKDVFAWMEQGAVPSRRERR